MTRDSDALAVYSFLLCVMCSAVCYVRISRKTARGGGVMAGA
jgi:hypothetical protein